MKCTQTTNLTEIVSTKWYICSNEERKNMHIAV